jgi:hypothetical protein
LYKIKQKKSSDLIKIYAKKKTQMTPVYGYTEAPPRAAMPERDFGQEVGEFNAPI